MAIGPPPCRTLDFSVTERTVGGYLKDIDEQLRAEREERMLGMWLACYDQRDISAAVGVALGQVNEFLQKCSDLESLPKSNKLAISHSDDFEPQVYSIWNFAKAT